MKVLIVHQNFPGQYKHLAPALAEDPKNSVVAIGEKPDRNPFAKVRYFSYGTPPGPTASTHHYIRGLEGNIRRGQTATRLALDIMNQEKFVPDIICSHPGWGDTIYFKDIFPNAKHLSFFEFYYKGRGTDVGFDPEHPATFDDLFRVRTKNLTNLLALESADWGVSPTLWQRAQFPWAFQPKISVIHDGIDTNIVKPDPSAKIEISSKQLVLSQQDEVVTYVSRNLEPYRGFHCFMRALPELLRRRPNAHVLIVGGDDVSYGRRLPEGEGTYRQKLLAEVGGQLDLNRVHFLGTIAYSSFLKVLQISSAHVYLTYPFVLSWSMLEAMAAECLVIGSKTPPVQEVIQDKVSGLLVDFFSPKELANTLDHALQHKEQYRPMRLQARQTILKHYDLHRVCLPQHIQLIETLVANRLPPSLPQAGY